MIIPNPKGVWSLRGHSSLMGHLCLSALVENYAKKNRSRNRLRFFWPTWFAVTKQLQICFFGIATKFGKHLGACNIPLERYFQYLFSGILHAPRFYKLHFFYGYFGFDFFGQSFLLVVVYDKTCWQWTPKRHLWWWCWNTRCWNIDTILSSIANKIGSLCYLLNRNILTSYNFCISILILKLEMTIFTIYNR